MVDFEGTCCIDETPQVYVVTYRKLKEDGMSLKELRKEYHCCSHPVDAYALSSSPLRRIVSIDRCWEDYDQPDERGESGLGRRGNEPIGFCPWEQEFIEALKRSGVSQRRATSVLITLNFAYEFFFDMPAFIGFSIHTSFSKAITYKSANAIGDCVFFLCGIRQFLITALKLQRAPNAVLHLGMKLPTRLHELTDPNHYDSIPGWYRRFYRRNCKLIGQTAVRDLLLLGCPEAFDVFFQVMDKIVPGEALYEVRSAFIDNLHEIHHYLVSSLPFNPIRRIWATRRLKKSSRKFKYSFRDLSRELYLYETGVKVVKANPAIEPSENSAIISEFAQILKALKPDQPKVDEEDEVDRSEAAYICGVGYNTIKRWEEEGRPEWARTYPGRRNRNLLIKWALGFQRNKRFRKGAKDIVLSSKIETAKKKEE